MAGVQALLPDERTRIGGTSVALVDPVAEPPLAVGAGAVVSPLSKAGHAWGPLLTKRPPRSIK